MTGNAPVSAGLIEVLEREAFVLWVIYGLSWERNARRPGDAPEEPRLRYAGSACWLVLPALLPAPRHGVASHHPPGAPSAVDVALALGPGNPPTRRVPARWAMAAGDEPQAKGAGQPAADGVPRRAGAGRPERMAATAPVPARSAR
ncbi:hypothetical protein LNQ03_33335 [Klebsiella pneumoniae subsp. pneumoniae]|nr:hypothetical protein [Klebsiella pneumoniae subsp. pneumoniae]